jgi:hypothetical protein
MGKRHDARRRKAYGRRRHDVQERSGRADGAERTDRSLQVDGLPSEGGDGSLGTLDGRAGRSLQFALGD